MVSKSVTELRAEAEKLVAANEQDTVSPSDRAAIVEAVAVDLGAADDQAVIAEDRLVKLEAQTEMLTEAVIAMTDAAATVAPAAKALKKRESD